LNTGDGGGDVGGRGLLRAAHATRLTQRSDQDVRQFP
jgi:hypothetical protein